MLGKKPTATDGRTGIIKLVNCSSWGLAITTQARYSLVTENLDTHPTQSFKGKIIGAFFAPKHFSDLEVQLLCATYRQNGICGKGMVRTNSRGRIGCCWCSDKTEENEEEEGKGIEIMQNKINTLNSINPLNTERRLLYLKTQFVPRSKHFSSLL